ncbi:MAG: hypothetical protein Q8938_11185 [Bacteroidota bacterium]|nr:hypothetical protein [Bacteroidota bacterium]
MNGLLAQTDGSATIRSEFDAYRMKGMQEKLFVHTDKTAYLAGEICWFKLYCLDGTSHRPLPISKLAYVDILDRDDRYLLQGKIALDQAEGEGSFYLPLTLASGNYKLRAYTNWMKNFGPDFFFEQPITIINTLKTLPAPAPALPSSAPASSSSVPASPSSAPADSLFEISFFPEGGDMVDGIRSKVAFRASDRQGRGKDCQGLIVDERKDTLATFHSGRGGLGQFWFTPTGGHHYEAIVRFPLAASPQSASSSQSASSPYLIKALPPVRSEGYTMHVAASTGRRLTITVHAKGPASPELYLFGRTGQSRPFVRKGQLTKDSTEFVLDKDSLGDGITQLTILDASLRPVSERLYFKRPAQPLAIALQTDKDRYDRRNKVTLSVSVPDSTAASLSLAVYRLDSLGQPPAPDIHAYLWLTSDLKGRIDSVERYFTLQGEEADLAFDDLMLTHGWRRFHWESIHRMANRQSSLPNPPEFSGQIITGRLTDIRTGEPLANRYASLSVPGVNYKFQYARTDTAGRLFFDIRDYFGTTGIVLHSGNNADSPCKVEMFSPFSEQFGGDRLLPFGLSQEQAGVLTRRSLGMQVQNIYTGDSMRQFRGSITDTLHFFGRPYRAYMLDDYTRFTTMEEVLREYVQEIGVNRPHGKLHVLMEDVLRKEFFNDDNTLVLLDGVPVPDDKIFNYDPLKVRRLEVVPMGYFLGPSAFSGIASFTTYKGNYEGLELDRHSVFVDYEGMQFKREFYSPAYETPEQAATHLPDIRDLMFWSPDIHADARGKTQLRFYTSDLPGKYGIVVQGITPDGRTCTATSEFEVD